MWQRRANFGVWNLGCYSPGGTVADKLKCIDSGFKRLLEALESAAKGRQATNATRSHALGAPPRHPRGLEPPSSISAMVRCKVGCVQSSAGQYLFRNHRDYGRKPQAAPSDMQSSEGCLPFYLGLHGRIVCKSLFFQNPWLCLNFA